MMFNKKDKKNEKQKEQQTEQKKLNVKDIAIVVLSVLLLVLLLLIVFVSRRRDKMISESLQRNSEMATDDAIANVNSSTMDDIEITEINSDKWIELHNTSTKAIDVSGLQFKISDKLEATIGDGTVIKNDKYYVVELESNPGKSEENVMSVVDTDGETVKTMIIPKLDEGKSFGIVDSENNIWGFFNPTKGKANSAKDVEYLEDGGIAFSAPGGFYDSSFSLELKCEDTEKIYYTTDGSRPTTESTLYEAPINITNKSGSKYVYARQAMYNRFHTGYMPGSVDAGMIVRAIKVNASGTTTGEMNQVYYVGLSKDSDYLNIPVISITTDPENLFGYEGGIYVAGKSREDALIQGLNGDYYANYYNAWEKPSKIEYYEPTKDKSFEIDADITVDSEKYSADRQKGFIISIGDEKTDDFAGSSILDFISDEGKIRLTKNYEDDDLKIRNLLAASLTEDTDIGLQNNQPCVVFLDGEYWGLYTLRSYIDSKYIKQKYGISTDEIIVKKSNGNNDSFHSFYNFATQNNLSIQDNYEQVKTMMDVDNFIDYVCLNMFLGNSSFSPSRGTAWRTSSSQGGGMADGRWRFISEDMSNTMCLTAKETPTINTYLQSGMQGDMLLQSLLMNDEFCGQLKNRMKKLVENNFNSEKCNEKLETITGLIKKPAMASYSRFHGTLSENEYAQGIENITSFFEERPDYILKYTEELAKKGGDLRKARELLEQEQEEERRREAREQERNAELTEEGEVPEGEEVNPDEALQDAEAAQTTQAVTGTNQLNAGEAQEAVDATQEKVDAAHEHVDASQENVDAAQEKVDATQENVDATQEKIDAGQ